MEDLAAIEESFKCSGLCQAPVFWVTRDVSLGQPPSGCIVSVYSEFKSNTRALSYCVFGTTAAILIVFIVHYGLYFKDSSQVKDRAKKFIFEN
jgi:hypothetical protein